MVMGSSGRPAPVISCMRALPIEVVRKVTVMSLPSIAGSEGTVVTRPSHEPARVFSLSKDFCASDWAKATTESNTRANAESVRRRNFMVDSPYIVWRGGGRFMSGAFRSLVYLTISLYQMHVVSLSVWRDVVQDR